MKMWNNACSNCGHVIDKRGFNRDGTCPYCPQVADGRELTIYSSGGTHKANTEGYVISAYTYVGSGPLDPDYLPQIERFDFEEYRKYWRLGRLDELPDTFDILDLGYWLKNAGYEKPCFETRRRIKENQGVMIASKVKPPPKRSIALTYEQVQDVLRDLINGCPCTDELASMAETLTGAELEWVVDCEPGCYKITEGPDYCGAFEGL